MSLISLKHWIPERGESNLKDEKQALEGLEKFKPEVPKRETPEKQLQAWIINQVIFGEVPSFWDKYNLTF